MVSFCSLDRGQLSLLSSIFNVHHHVEQSEHRKYFTLDQPESTQTSLVRSNSFVWGHV